MTSDDDDAIARLRLIRTPSIGPITYFQLIQRFGTAQAALSVIPDLARRGGGKPPALATVAAIEREMASVARAGASYLFIGRAPYPNLLAELESAPPALIIAGDTGLLARPIVAMVGARNASAAAVRFARQIAHDLAEAGWVVASGLARGIDAAAHEGALEGGTIGVIAGGIDIFYPPENEALQRTIASRGLVIAEQPPGPSRARATSPIATASSRGWRRARWWSRRRCARARSSPPGWPPRRGARSWRCRARRSIRAHRAATS